MSTPDLSTREGRDQLRALADKATPGPWEAEFSGEQGNCVLPPDYRSTREAVAVTRLYYAQADAEFIAASRTAVPTLLDALDAAEADRNDEADSTRWLRIELASESDRAQTAEARADRAEAALQRVREKHKRSELARRVPRMYREDPHDQSTRHFCTECAVDYPCPTIRALDGHDGDPATPCGRGPCCLGDGHTGNCRM